MSLPVLQVPTADLVRAAARAELHWTSHIAEQSQLDVGVAFTNPAFRDSFAANRVQDAALPPGVTPQAAVEQVAAHFAEAGTPCLCWSIDDTLPVDRTQPLRDDLVSIGAAADIYALMTLRRPSASRPAPSGVVILPARAALRHLLAWAVVEAVPGRLPEQTAELKSLHLDDPHTDAIMALHDGQPVGYAAVLAAGEIGLVKSVFVDPLHRGRSIGRYLMQRILEICARSQFRHVLLKVGQHSPAAQNLYRSLGFEKIAQGTNYRFPATHASS